MRAVNRMGSRPRSRCAGGAVASRGNSGSSEVGREGLPRGDGVASDRPPTSVLRPESGWSGRRRPGAGSGAGGRMSPRPSAVAARAAEVATAPPLGKMRAVAGRVRPFLLPCVQQWRRPPHAPGAGGRGSAALRVGEGPGLISRAVAHQPRRRRSLTMRFFAAGRSDEPHDHRHRSGSRAAGAVRGWRRTVRHCRRGGRWPSPTLRAQISASARRRARRRWRRAPRVRRRSQRRPRRDGPRRRLPPQNFSNTVWAFATVATRRRRSSTRWRDGGGCAASRRLCQHVVGSRRWGVAALLSRRWRWRRG